KRRPVAPRAAPTPALAFVTLGCPKNTVDSESMLGLMVADGFRTVGDPGEADIAVVNTCAFLGSAVRESKQTIARVAELKHAGRLKGLIVTGCLAQRAGTSLLAEFPEVDAVLGTGQWREIVPAARHVLAGGARRALTDYPGGALDSLTPRALSTPRHLAYLKISEGCDHRCTFCIIPRLRGDQRSRPVEDLVAEAERLARAGVRELNLIGQDTTGYGTDLPGRPTLADLLEALDQVEGLHWIRVQYTYPRLWSDRLISVWANAKRVVPYVDMPLQHIAADMLRAMARGMTGRDTRALVRRIKEGIPGVSFRTNFIVGFPGETEAQFDELMHYIEEEPFDHVVVFPYEREPETASYRMAGGIPAAERRRRRARLLERQQVLSRDRQARRIGERLTVMIDAPLVDNPRGQVPSGGPSRYAARTAGSAWEVDGGVVVEGEHLQPGTLVPVRITGAAAYDLFARTETTFDALISIV
ncbi:MAG TPA: 30S ribosomal protein S12 methylthiotransferase RimO, partial [Candidatus Eisenbacteria bacterium]|nr:30S ribosomal protein S12 methylthiotransferase RimO [Candidatus Eisenbacteria bacterium]